MCNGFLSGIFFSKLTWTGHFVRLSESSKIEIRDCSSRDYDFPLHWDMAADAKERDKKTSACAV
jgi:hypothetical protein